MALLRVGLLGCGIISDAHVRAYEKLADRARIVACCDIDLARARQRAEQIGGPSATTEYGRLLEDPDIDAIEVCTPHHLHEDAVVAAARAGKHVLCQKPLAKTLASCDAMIEAARTAGVVLFYGETNRTMNTAVEARRAVIEGRVGRLIGIQATFAFWQGGNYLSTSWRYDPAVTGGGQLLDSGIHMIDVMNHVGGPIESVSCFATRFRTELGGEDTATLIAQFREGHLGQIFTSQAAGIWYPGAGFAAFGTEGVLTVGGPHGALALHRPDIPGNKEVLLDHATRGDSFATMIERYLDAIQLGADNPSPGEVGREDLRVVLAAYESARLGRAVRLDDLEQGAHDG